MYYQLLFLRSQKKFTVYTSKTSASPVYANYYNHNSILVRFMLQYLSIFISYDPIRSADHELGIPMLTAERKEPRTYRT